ncbi:MAG TPA: hypothetical protein VIH21_09865 [Dehalococcoidia bacterium]|jgi:hypothetical protein
MAKRDPERTRKIRIAVRYLMERDSLQKGNQTRLAEHFHVSRQRVHQIVVEERQRAVSVGGQMSPLAAAQQMFDTGSMLTAFAGSSKA